MVYGFRLPGFQGLGLRGLGVFWRLVLASQVEGSDEDVKGRVSFGFVIWVRGETLLRRISPPTPHPTDLKT